MLTRQVTDLMNIEPSTHAPPVLLFTWAFAGVHVRAGPRVAEVRDVPAGRHAGARAADRSTFNEYRNVDLEAKEIKRETGDYSKRHVVVARRDPGLDRRARVRRPALVAADRARQRIDEPRDALPPACGCSLPHLPYRDPDSGRVLYVGNDDGSCTFRSRLRAAHRRARRFRRSCARRSPSVSCTTGSRG